ncbi:MAG: PhzF family phenazine biosynthesis protein [Atopobiaceae bacterium]|nr:PhzF family phenazine biosynthesis protein [Atopobiaceae bacterium]
MIPYYVVDAFAEKPFEGNPAGVCVLDDWLDDELMQQIAAENRLSETAFAVRTAPGSYLLRWFTPTSEIDLCGHATFGTSFVLFRFYEPEADVLRFHAPYKGYDLTCTRQGERIQMEFPRIAPQPIALSQQMVEAVGATPSEVLATERDLVLVYDDEETVNGIHPSMDKVAQLEHGLSVYVTAPSANWDYVARAFWPKIGIPEDPVCGSMQSALVPYWSKRLGKRELVCRQTSKRGGTVWCEDTGDAVLISGTGTLYLQGQIL